MVGSELLRDKIETFIAEKNRPQVFNHRYFCDQLGMSKPTFSRTINGKRVPTVEEVRKICQILNKPDDVSEILKGYYSQDELQHLSFDTKKLPFVMGSLQQYLANPRYFDLVILARNKKLFKSQYIEDYGHEGAQRIKELLDFEILRLEGDQLFLELEGSQLDIPVLKECIKNTLKFHKASNSGKMRNQIFFYAGRVDAVKRTRIFEILNTVRLIVAEILTKGEISLDSKQKMISLMDFNHGENQGAEEVVSLGLVFDDLYARGIKDLENKDMLQ